MSEGTSALGPSTADDSDRVSKVTKTSGNFQCPKCPKQFSRIENLNRHQATHEATGRFQCIVCLKRFTRSDLLNRHRKIHDNAPQPGLGNAGTYSHSELQQIPNRRKENQPSNEIKAAVPPVPGGVRQPQDYAPDPPKGYPTRPSNKYQLPRQQQQQPTLGSVTLPILSQPLPRVPYGPPQHVPYMQATDRTEATIASSVGPVLDDRYKKFMPYDDQFNMGSYDADIAWTFDFAQQDLMMDFPWARALLPPVVPPYAYYNRAVPQEQGLSVQDRSLSKVNSQESSASSSEEEVSSDWPDNVSQPGSPTRTPIVRRWFDSSFWKSVQDEALADTHVFHRYYHGSIDGGIRERQIELLGLQSAAKVAENEVFDAVYPDPYVLNYFLQLYLHNVQPRFPVLHLPTFKVGEADPLLLVVMALVGSSYSRADRGKFCSLLYNDIRNAVLLKCHQHEGRSLRGFDRIMTFFLFCLAGTWGGNKQAYEFAEGARGILITSGRRCRLLDARPSSIHYKEPMNTLHDTWLAWVDIERNKRLGLAIYIFDCQYPTFFNNQMYISKAETTNSVFPCPSEYWEAATAESWNALVDYQYLPPPTYCLHALNFCLLQKSVRPEPIMVKLNEYDKIVLLYALHTHIFEWRQAISMLNPIGLSRAFGTQAHDIGQALRERQNWLLGALDTFASFYLTPSTSIASKLLHELGYVSLHLSISDLHLAAGRLGGVDDGELAEQALFKWANGPEVHPTMQHVVKMLDLAHESVQTGTAKENSFEVSVCLFTGGLACWACNKLSRVITDRMYSDQVTRASKALRNMGSWRIATMFGVILERFDGSTQESRA